MTQETKVGAFLLFAVGVIMTSILLLGNISIFKRYTPYFTEFDDVQALPPKAAVKISGVEVGKVLGIQLINGRARVKIGVSRDIVLNNDTKARIGSTGIIGTRFVELFPGTSAAGVLEPDSIIQGAKGGSIEDMVSRFGAILEDDPKYGNAVQNLKATLSNIRRVSDSLNLALGNHGEDLEEVVMNIKDLSASAKVFAAHLEEISTEKKDDFKIAITKFKEVGTKLDAILTKINNGEGAIGALVSDEKTGNDVKAAVASIKDTAASAKKVLGRFTSVNTYWDYRNRYDFRDHEDRSDVAITFVPRPGKFYSFGATNIGETADNEKHTVFERKNRINAVIGASLGPVSGYVGAIRSRGGVGVDVKPLYKNKKLADRFTINAEAADFSRDRVVNNTHLNSAWVAAGIHMALTRWLWVGIRDEDILDRPALQGYANIIFRDEDLAYILGLATVAGH